MGCALLAATVAALLAERPSAPAGWTTHRLTYPLTFTAHPHLIPNSSNKTLAPCFTACEAAHRAHPHTSSGCVGFTACSSGPVGCWIYSDIAGGELAPSPACDWHASPWFPPASPPLCTGASCVMCAPTIPCVFHRKRGENMD